MSRIVVFDLENRAVGEFDARCNRGYMVYGNTGVDGAGETTVQVPDDVISQGWLQLGNMVLIQRPPLPAWAGMIDTPWRALLPAQLTLYNMEYLFALRTPDIAARLSGSIPQIVRQMIDVMNEQQQTYLSLGRTSGEQTSHDETLEQRTIWEQLVPMLERTGYEMVMRPELSRGRLNIYADVGVYLGTDTGFLLDDGGPGKNMTVLDASLNGEIINRIKGVSGSSTAEDQIQTDIFEDLDSQNTYRTRSQAIQFQKITQLSTLEEYTRVYLEAYKQPYLDLTVKIMDKGQAFANLWPGNRLIAHSSNLYLPGGIHGWRGSVRILAMAYNEDDNTVETKLRGTL